MVGSDMLLWALCVLSAAAMASTPPQDQNTSIHGQRVWALETFVDLEDAQGDVMHAELRYHCSHSISTIASHFCREFEVPNHDCARLEHYLAHARSLGACDTDSWKTKGATAQFVRLGTMEVTVRREEEGNRTQSIKVAIHQGDLEILDTRADHICTKFKLDVSVCGEVRQRMYTKTLALEVSNVKGSCKEGHNDVQAILEVLEKRAKALEEQLEEKVRIIRRLAARAEREKLELERRVRILEATVRLSNQTNHMTNIVLETVDATGTVRPRVRHAPVTPIPRHHVSNFSYAQYLEFARSSTPVIIQGIADLEGSPGVPRWSLEYLNQTCGEVEVTLKKPAVSLGTKSTSQMMWAGIQTATSAPLRDFLRDFISSQRVWPTGLADLYLHDTSIRAFCPRLLSNFTVPRFFVDDRMQLMPRLPQRDYWPSLFVGGPTTSSALHTDWGHTAAWMGLVAGRKHWAIAKPSARALLEELVPLDYLPTAKRFNASLLERSPALAELLQDEEVFEDVLEPGEVLFIPADCPHQVRNLDKTVAVAANFVDSANLDAFRRGLEEAKEFSSGEIYQLYTMMLQDIERAHTLPSALSPELSLLEFADLPFSVLKSKYNQL